LRLSFFARILKAKMFYDLLYRPGVSPDFIPKRVKQDKLLYISKLTPFTSTFCTVPKCFTPF